MTVITWSTCMFLGSLSITIYKAHVFVSCTWHTQIIIVFFCKIAIVVEYKAIGFLVIDKNIHFANAYIEKPEEDMHAWQETIISLYKKVDGVKNMFFTWNKTIFCRHHDALNNMHPCSLNNCRCSLYCYKWCGLWHITRYSRKDFIKGPFCSSRTPDLVLEDYVILSFLCLIILTYFQLWCPLGNAIKTIVQCARSFFFLGAFKEIWEHDALGEFLYFYSIGHESLKESLK